MAYFNYKGTKVEASSKDEAIRKIVAESSERRFSDAELKAMAKELCDKLKSVIEGARIDMDFLHQLSYKIAREKLGVDGLTIEANYEPLFSYGHKVCWGNRTWNGSNDELEVFRIEGLGCLDYVYFNVSNCKATLSTFDIVNQHLMGSTWVWDDYADADKSDLRYGDL